MLNKYLHVELSLLSFHERVLNMTQKNTIPLLERLKFLCIFSSNLDEFFEIKVSGLKARAQSTVSSEGVDGLTPTIALDAISERVHKLVKQQYETLNEVVMPELSENGIRFLNRDQWDDKQSKWIKNYFKQAILPVLTPIRLDPSHPFPLTINKGLSIVVDLHDPERDDTHNIAVVPAPRVLPRFIRLPEELSNKEYEYVYLSTIIHAHINKLFSNVDVLGCYQVRITRNSDLYVDLEEVEDLARTLEGELPSRLYGEAVRLEVSKDCPKRIVRFLQERFQISDGFVFQVDGPVNLNRLIGLGDQVNRPELKYPGFTPSVPQNLTQHNTFEAITNSDILLHHPFQSFAPVVDLLRQAASDSDVLVIKQTLYRTGSDSVLVELLAEAARAGKEVTVIIELMARFDEKNNLATAEKLQNAGAHVVYGLVGKKTHAKMLMIVRREGNKLCRFVHLGTGNYHQGNTRTYTDYGLLTCNKSITQDVHELFMQLTTHGPNPSLEVMHQSPHGIAEMFIKQTQNEIANVKQGKPAKIIAKVNGLSSKRIIDALYRASQAGVKIHLIVRGICTIKPGIKGLSDNIEVRSVVGRFLEHARVFYFENSENDALVFLSSADLMPRNLRNRIEQCTPILEPSLKHRIINDLNKYLQDTENTWVLKESGDYVQLSKNDQKRFDVQTKLLEEHGEDY